MEHDLKNFILLCALSLLLPLSAHSARAQQAALTPGAQVEGLLTPGSSQTWTFAGVAGQVVSFQTETITGDLDPILSVIDSSSRVLISNDDYAPPETRDSLLEAITLSRTDVYQVVVSAYGQTSGRYTLATTSGFATSVVLGPDDWQPLGSADAVSVRQPSAGALAAVVRGARTLEAVVNRPDAPGYGNFYASVNVTSVSNNTGWLVGMIAHEQAGDYYALDINDQGAWRFRLHRAGADTTLREWVTSPAIRAGETAFRLSILARNGAYHLFYNDAPLGAVSDTTLAAEGHLGITLGTTTSLESETSAVFQSLMVTTPLLYDGSPVHPTELITGDSGVMTQQLVRRTTIDGSGVLTLNVPEGTIQVARPGISRLMLGQSTRYTTFALGTEITISGQGENGCGIVFGYAGENDYWLAYFDALGGAGISRRTAAGFEPGLHRQDAAFAGGGAHDLLMIANPTTLTYYLDGQYVGSLEAAPQEGEVGIAVVNTDSTTTDCTARDLWLWR